MARTYRLIPLVCALSAILLVGCYSDRVVEPAGLPTQAKPMSASPTAEPPVVTLTPKAVGMVRQAIADYNADEPAPGTKLYLRIRVIPGGCQGFMQKLDLDPTTTADDYIFETEGVSVVILRRQVDMLRGTQVDFVEENGKVGFKVENPNFNGDWTKKWLPVLEGEKEIK